MASRPCVAMAIGAWLRLVVVAARRLLRGPKRVPRRAHRDLVEDRPARATLGEQLGAPGQVAAPAVGDRGVDLGEVGGIGRDRLDGLEPRARRRAVAGAEDAGGVPRDEQVATRPDRDRHRAQAPVADLERRAEVAAGAAHADEHTIVVNAAVLEVGDRGVPAGVEGEHRAVESRAVGDRVRRSEGADRAAEGDRQARAPDRGRADGAVAQRDRPRLRVGRDVDDVRGRGALGPEAAGAGRARGQAPAAVRALPGAVLPRPPRQGGAVARGGHGDRRHEQVRQRHVLRRRPRRVGDGHGGEREGQEPGKRGEAANHGAATHRAGAELRAGRLHRLNGGQHEVRHNRRSPLHAHCARANSTPSPRAGSRRAARRRALPRRAGGARAHRADLPRPVGPDVRPVGLDHLGPRDPAPRSVDGRRAVVEAAARSC